MPDVRLLPAVHPRVETGAVRHGDDWPGLFVRGDDCIRLFALLRLVEEISRDADPAVQWQLKRLDEYRRIIGGSAAGEGEGERG